MVSPITVYHQHLFRFYRALHDVYGIGWMSEHPAGGPPDDAFAGVMMMLFIGFGICVFLKSLADASDPMTSGDARKCLYAILGTFIAPFLVPIIPLMIIYIIPYGVMPATLIYLIYKSVPINWHRVRCWALVKLRLARWPSDHDVKDRPL